MRSSIVKTTPFLVSACFFIAGSAVWAGTVIEGKVDHSEYQQALDGFRVGGLLDESRLPSGEESNGTWWRVPNWLAGQWHKSGRITVLSFKDLKTQEDVKSKKHIHVHYPDNEILGHQTDGKGDVWTYVPVPYVVRNVSGNVINVNIVNSFQEVDSSEDSVTLKMFTVTIMVDKLSNKVISICQRESLQTFTSVSETKVSIFDSTKFFDRDGEALATKRVQTFSERCGPYCQINFLDQKTNRPLSWQASYTIPEELKGLRSVPLDLRDSLASYLRTHNLTSLIP